MTTADQQTRRWSAFTTAAFILLPLTGAVGGALTHRAAEFPYRAEAMVVADSASDQTPMVAFSRRLSEVIRLPGVLAEARREAGAHGRIDDRVDAKGDPAAGIVRLVAYGETSQAAVGLADAVANNAAGFMRALEAGQGLVPVADFETRLERWGTVSRFSVPARRQRMIRGGARFHLGALELECAAVVGCGTTTRVHYPFQRGIPYTARAWLRSPDPAVPLTLVFGAETDDFAGAPPRRPKRRWTPFSVVWVPKKNAAVAEISVQTASAKATVFTIDGISIADGSSGASGTSPSFARVENRLFEASRVLRVFPAVPREKVETMTWEWAVLGAGAGLAAAFLIAGYFSIGRRREIQPSTSQALDPCATLNPRRYPGSDRADDQ